MQLAILMNASGLDPGSSSKDATRGLERSNPLASLNFSQIMMDVAG